MCNRNSQFTLGLIITDGNPAVKNQDEELGKNG